MPVNNSRVARCDILARGFPWTLADHRLSVFVSAAFTGELAELDTVTQEYPWRQRRGRQSGESRDLHNDK